MSDRSGPQSLASLWLLSELCWVLKIEFHVCSTVGVFAVISQTSGRIKRNNIYNIARMLRVLRFSKMVSWQVCWSLRYMSIANGISRKLTLQLHWGPWSTLPQIWGLPPFRFSLSDSGFRPRYAPCLSSPFQHHCGWLKTLITFHAPQEAPLGFCMTRPTVDLMLWRIHLYLEHLS